MTCRELDDRLDGYLAGEVSSAERADVELHLAGCSPCEKYVESYRRTLRAAKAAFAGDAAPSELRAELVRSIVTALRRSRS
jgi:anti-sigma factor RsiW